MRLSSQLSRAPSWFTTIAHREDATPVICFRAPPSTLSPSRRPCRKGARSLPPGTSPSASPPLTPNVAPYSDGRATQSPGTPPLSPGLAAAPRGPRLTDLPPSCLRHLPLRLPTPKEPFSGSLPPFRQHPPFPPASLTVLHPFLSGVDPRAALWSPDSMEDVDLARYRSTLCDVASCIPGVTCFRGLFGIALSSSS